VHRAASLLATAAASVLLVGCTSAAITQPTPAAAPPVSSPTVLIVSPTSLAQQWVPAPRTKTTGCESQGGLPDPACTPGAIDPRVTQANISTTICMRGYTATVRPPTTYTDPLKQQEMAAYGLTGQPLSGEELDHLISLELGGAPRDVANLWPEPWNGADNAHMKDAVENFLNREVCRGTIQLVEAQREIATDWLAVYRSRGLRPAQ
jgi:hypothetical protein